MHLRVGVFKCRTTRITNANCGQTWSKTAPTTWRRGRFTRQLLISHLHNSSDSHTACQGGPLFPLYVAGRHPLPPPHHGEALRHVGGMLTRGRPQNFRVSDAWNQSIFYIVRTVARHRVTLLHGRKVWHGCKRVNVQKKWTARFLLLGFFSNQLKYVHWLKALYPSRLFQEASKGTFG